jgi:hypothetical protein
LHYARTSARVERAGQTNDRLSRAPSMFSPQHPLLAVAEVPRLMMKTSAASSACNHADTRAELPLL